MRLIEQLIKKRMELHQEFVLNRHYLRAIWMFYQGYALALLVLQERDKELEKKCLLWRRCLLSPDAFDSKQLKLMMNYITNDYQVVIRALDKLEQDKLNASENFGDFYKPLTIGIMSYEYPDEIT